MSNTAWQAPQKPIDYAERALVTAILDGTFPPNTKLPGERTLATQLGVTRPTLREVIRRLERDGWLTVQQGKATRVNNFWQEGGLNLLSTLIQYGSDLPANFIPNLLQIRLDLAPTYTLLATQNDPHQVSQQLATAPDLTDSPHQWAQFDWQLHHTLTILSGNPIYTLILNGFASFYVHMAQIYFALPESRQHSLTFYQTLDQLAQKISTDTAVPPSTEQWHTAVLTLTQQTMAASLDRWTSLTATATTPPTGASS